MHNLHNSERTPIDATFKGNIVKETTIKWNRVNNTML